jgi:hypothetical protein
MHNTTKLNQPLLPEYNCEDRQKHLLKYWTHYKTGPQRLIFRYLHTNTFFNIKQFDTQMCY